MMSVRHRCEPNWGESTPLAATRERNKQLVFEIIKRILINSKRITIHFNVTLKSRALNVRLASRSIVSALPPIQAPLTWQIQVHTTAAEKLPSNRCSNGICTRLFGIRIQFQPKELRYKLAQVNHATGGIDCFILNNIILDVKIL